jgi:hypothetical protein
MLKSYNNRWLHSLLAEFDNNITKNIILPKVLLWWLLGSNIKDMMTLNRWTEPTTWRTYNEITMSSWDHKDKITIRPVLSDIKKNTISPDLQRVTSSIYTQCKNNWVNFIMQQTAYHLDSPVKSNDNFTSRGQGLKGLRESILWWLFESSKPTKWRVFFTPKLGGLFLV